MTTPVKIPDNIKELANATPVADPNYVSVIYGDYGSRKTTTACSMVNERGLLMSTDDSWKVLLNPRHKHLYDKLKIVKLEGLSQLQYIDFEGFDTIIWDTVSQSVDTFLDLLYDEAGWGKNPNGTTKYRDAVITKNKELIDMRLETLAPVDYRVTRDALRPILNNLFARTTTNLIFTSQLTEPIPNLSKNQQARPSIPQATFKILGTRADIIGYAKATGVKYTVDVTNSLTQLGKSRIEGIQGNMDQDAFVTKYKEIVFK